MPKIDCVQYSDAWCEARRGLPTASQFKRIVKGDGSSSTQRTGYLYECAAVRITGIYKDTYKSAAMQEGNDREALSRMIYAMEHEVAVDEVAVDAPRVSEDSSDRED